jgi:serine/threonine-protein kinase
MSEEISEAKPLGSAMSRHVDHVCDCFEAAWKAWQSGEPPRIADFLGTAREPERPVLLGELIQLELHYRNERGESWSTDEIKQAHSDIDMEWLTNGSGLDGSPADTADFVSCKTPANSQPPVGMVHFEGYEVLETIRSGMSVVYKARQARPQRLVALKTMPPTPGVSVRDQLQFLHREGERLAQLAHPNIVPIYEVGASRGRPFLTMKWITGGSLAQSLASGRWHAIDAAAIRIAAELMIKIARAVHYAHQRGILHLDLKPANILLDENEQPIVSDFGLAQPVIENSPTESDGTVGTPSYMAPEQAAGGKGITTRTDVYGLGAVFYELLTGRPPFRCSSIRKTLNEVMERQPDAPSQRNPLVAEDVEIICLKCLAKAPEERYSSAEELANDLERWLNGEPIQARPTYAWERAIKWARRRPASAALFGLSAAVSAFILVLIVWQWQVALNEQAAAHERKKRARVKDAVLLSHMVSEAQHLYSTEVVDRVKHKVDVSHDYTMKDATIPLPPTLTMILAQRISEKRLGTVRLYSDKPFRSRKNPPELDQFQKDALAALRQKPAEPYFHFEDWQGRPSLRYATADVMRKRCLECHNNHPDSPYKIWREGDVRGVLEVILPLE